MSSNLDLETIKLVLQSILISSKDPIPINELKKVYWESEGREIPFTKMGYSNALDFLNTLKDTLIVLPDNTVKAVESKDQQHLVRLIRKQKNSSKSVRKSKSSYQSNFYNYTQTQYNRQRSNRQRNQCGTLSRPRYSGQRNQCSTLSRPRYSDSTPDNSDRKQTQSYLNQNSYRNDTPVRNLRPPISSSSDSYEDSFEVVNCGTSLDSEDEETNKIAKLYVPEVTLTRVDFLSALTPQLKSNLREIIREHPKGVLCSHLSHLVQEKYGVSLHYRKYGFTSVLQMVDSLPGIVKYEDKSNSDWLLLDAQNSYNNSPIRDEGFISEEVFQRIYEVALTITYPVLTSKFEKRYECMFRRSLSEEVEGFVDIDLFLTSVDKKIVHLEKIGKDYYVLPFKRTHGALDVDSDSDDIDYPKNMLALGVEVPSLEPLSNEISPTMKIRMGEIYSPHKFFIIYSYMNESFNHLDTHIQLFYSKSDHLALTGLPVKKGLYCVVQYFDKWHRAVILEVRNPNKVIVFLIDFGTSLKVSKEELRFLHEDFASIPRLAVRASMLGVAPLENGEKFSAEANRLFLKLTADKELIAFVKIVDDTLQKYFVHLAEKEGDSLVTISEKLISAGVSVATDSPLISSEDVRRFEEELRTPELQEEKEKTTIPNITNLSLAPKMSTGALLTRLLNRSM